MIEVNERTDHVDVSCQKSVDSSHYASRTHAPLVVRRQAVLTDETTLINGAKSIALMMPRFGPASILI